ncbi:putative leader peptide [Pseudonocardia alni]
MISPNTGVVLFTELTRRRHVDLSRVTSSLCR